MPRFGLAKHLIEHPIAGGEDRKTNAKLVLPGKLLRLENGRFFEGGSIRKRNGYTALPREVLGAADLSSGNALGTFNDELLLFNAGTLYSYSTALAKWVSRGGTTPFSARARTIFGAAATATNPDVASNGSVTLYAWTDSRGGVRATVVDEDTGTIFLAETAVSATGVRPKCVLIGAYLFVLYIEGTNLRAKRISTADPTAFSGAFTLRVDVEPTAGEQHLDVIPFAADGGPANTAVFAYTTNGDVTLCYLLESGVVGDGANGYPGPEPLGVSAEQALTIAGSDDASINGGTVFAANAAGLYGVAWTEAFNVQPAIETYAGAGVVNVTAVVPTPFEGDVLVFFELDDATDTEHVVMYVETDESGAGPAPTEIMRSVGLASKAFIRDGVAYVNTVFAGTLQSHYFTIDSAGTVQGRLLSQNAGGLQDGALPGVVESGDEFFWSAPFKTRFVSEGNVTYSRIGVARSSMIFASGDQYRGAQAGENLLLPGGYVGAYDGASVVESGFHVFPEGIAAPAHNAAGGSMSGGGRFSFVFLYEWYDAKGQRHQSAPSVPVIFDVPAGTETNRLSFSVPTLRITGKSDVRIVSYSTIEDGTVYFRTGHQAGSPTDGVANDPTVDTVTFERTVADASIEANEILYSQGVNSTDGGGGELTNVCPPCARQVVVGKRRGLLVGLEDPYAFQYSKIILPGRGVEWNDALRDRIDPAGGELTAGAFLDDKIILFTRDSIYVVAGEGPDNTGANGTFSSPFLLTTDVGCVEPRSIAPSPTGIVFQTAKGLYELTRGLQVLYVGAEAEALNGQTITNATLVEDANEIRFLTDDGDTLVFDYFFKQWGRWTNHEGVGAVLYDGIYHYLRADGEVYVEAEGVYTDDGLPVRLKLQTAWLKAGSVQGFKRIWRLALIGDLFADHKLRGRLRYDYRDFVEETFTFDAATVFDTTTFGELAFGTGSFGGDAQVADRVYQMRHHLKKQKCEAISLEIEDIGSDVGGGYSIAAVALEVGLMPGIMRLPAQKTV